MKYHVLTNNGGREVNEDYAAVLTREDGSFCAVLADGLGGHGRGEVASELVVRNSLSLWETFSGKTEDFLNLCFQDSQEKLLQKQLAEHAQDSMKTTMTALVCDGKQVQWGHIGDSRLYMFQDNKIATRTLDHSVPQMLVATGEIKEKDIRGHEDRNRLLKVMGTPWDKPKYELADPVPCRKEMAFLLSSDGFWELVEDRDMVSCLKKAATPKEWLEAMEQIVLKNGVGKKMDNYTAIGVLLGDEKEKKTSFFKKLFG